MPRREPYYIVNERDQGPKVLPAIDKLVDPMHYVLFRMFCDHGWYRDFPEGVSQREFYAHQLMFRDEQTKCVSDREGTEHFPGAHWGGRLFQQLIVDWAARLID